MLVIITANNHKYITTTTIVLGSSIIFKYLINTEINKIYLQNPEKSLLSNSEQFEKFCQYLSQPSEKSNSESTGFINANEPLRHLAIFSQILKFMNDEDGNGEFEKAEKILDHELNKAKYFSLEDQKLLDSGFLDEYRVTIRRSRHAWRLQHLCLGVGMGYQKYYNLGESDGDYRSVVILMEQLFAEWNDCKGGFSKKNEFLLTFCRNEVNFNFCLFL